MRYTAICLVLALCGCSTYRPYTGMEKTLMGAALTFQAADVATTSYALSQPGFSEGNAIWWGDNDSEILIGMLASKLVICGVAYLAGQAWPETRTWIWGIVGAGGASMAAWNTYQAIRH